MFLHFTVSLKTQTLVFNEILEKFNLSTDEQLRYGKCNSPKLLNEFVESGTSTMTQLQDVFKRAKNSFKECVEYFGESPNSSENFFKEIFSFIVNFSNARKEVEAKQKNINDSLK